MLVLSGQINQVIELLSHKINVEIDQVSIIYGFLYYNLLDKYINLPSCKKDMMEILAEEMKCRKSSSNNIGMIEKNFYMDLKFMNQNSDEISVEMILKYILKKESTARDVLFKLGITDAKIEQEMRKHQVMREFIDTVSYDLVAMAKAGRLEEILLRDDEIDECIVHLSKKKKNNPLLIGKAGVGKTAIIEGLAIRIAQKKVPERLLGKHIRVLEISKLLEKTKYRGELEEKLTKLLNFISEIKDIIFIDEIHLIVSAGAAEGGIDMGNMLKPYLARGDIQFIGATTKQEYEKYIMNDQALDRRFGIIEIEEMSIRQMEIISEKLIRTYEKFHNVKFDRESIISILSELDEIVNNRYFPDKFIDILDFCGAKYYGEENHISLEMMRNAMSLIFKQVGANI